ncbi:glycosyltransferase [Curtobacterium sp. CFBP9011]|uniref:glycosyltransferase n=1 Tax=Curtobacterium sp. CFBP9011 TaxID=3096530 RepID=UPI002A69B633|nr:glycosyltransferase [Curtobacterium sp. CFBP9011]MDY1005450.1 glycosyltransferase [Curtobacterium sp. CFBP9011]
MKPADRQPSNRTVVAFLTHSAALSGSELFLLRVTSAMASIRPVVILAEHGPLEVELASAGVECHVVPLAKVARTHRDTHQAVTLATLAKVSAVGSVAVRIARLCRSRGVELVTTHSAKAHVYGALAACLASVPSVMHLHGVIGAGSGARANAAVLRLTARLLATAIIANSRHTAASIGRNRKPLTVIGCPVGSLGAARDESPVPVVSVIGRLSPFKGQDIVIRAFATAAHRGLPTGVRLRIVGDALFERDADFARTLPLLAAELGVADRIDFIGHSQDVAGELARSSVVVHGSRAPEGFGQVVVEAMAAGRAVIATAAGGPSEVIRHGVDGLLVPPADVEALAGALRFLLVDPARRAELGAAARASAQRFSTAVIVPQLERTLLRWTA